MSSTYRVVKLLKNHLYPTYQLHAFMANEKTTPQDGLRLAALTTMQWLKIRRGTMCQKNGKRSRLRKSICPRPMTISPPCTLTRDM